MGKCEHAIGIPGVAGRNGSTGVGSYEIGVMKNRDGDGFRVVFDSWGPGQKLSRIAGHDLSRLRQEYAVAVTLRKAEKLKRKGFSVKREDLAGGRVRLVMRKR